MELSILLNILIRLAMVAAVSFAVVLPVAFLYISRFVNLDEVDIIIDDDKLPLRRWGAALLFSILILIANLLVTLELLLGQGNNFHYFFLLGYGSWSAPLWYLVANRWHGQRPKRKNGEQNQATRHAQRLQSLQEDTDVDLEDDFGADLDDWDTPVAQTLNDKPSK